MSRFEYRSLGVDGALGTVRRRFFDWLDGRSFPAAVREELLGVVSAVAAEFVAPVASAFTVTAEDAGGNVYLRFSMPDHEDDPARLGRCMGVVDRLAQGLSVAVVTVFGDRHFLIDVTLPGP